MFQRFGAAILLVLCGIGLLVAWMPGPLPWYAFQAASFLLLAIWAVSWMAGRTEAAWSWLLLPPAGVIGWGALQLAMGWSVYEFATRGDILRWAAYLAVFFLSFQLFDWGRSGWFRTAFSWYALALATVSVLQYFAGNGRIYWLFEPAEPAGLGPFLNRDHYASFMALALPMTAVEMLRRPGQRWLFALMTAILYVTVVAGASRAGFVLVTVELIFLGLVLRFSGRLALAVAGLVVVLGFVVGWDTLYERLKAPDPYAGRREVAAATLRMIESNPWRGSGLGTWTRVYPRYAAKDFGVFVNAAHNDWLQWAADGGLVAAGLLLLLFAGACTLVPRVPWVLGVPMVFVHGVVDFPLQGKFLPVMVFLVLGVATRSAKKWTKWASERTAHGGSGSDQ